MSPISASPPLPRSDLSKDIDRDAITTKRSDRVRETEAYTQVTERQSMVEGLYLQGPLDRAATLVGS
jgi:hypothetical protein